MKQTLTTLFLLLSLAGFSQTQKGFHVIGNVGTTNVSRDQRLLITVSPEAGYFGKHIGLTAVYNNTVNLYKGSTKYPHNPKGRASSVGLKAYGKLFNVDAIHFFVTAEADRYIDKIDKQINGKFEFRPGATIAIPIFVGVDARFSYQNLIYKQGGEVKHRNGGSIGFSVKL